MKCSECRENLSEYIDGELPEAEQDDIAVHVRDCPDCAAVLDRMRRAVQALRGMPQEVPPPDFMVRLNERLDAEDLKRSRRGRFFLGWSFLLPGAATVAMACLAIVLVSRYLEIPLPGSGPQQALPRSAQQQDMLAAELKSAPAAAPQAEALQKNHLAAKEEQLRAAQSESRPAPAASVTKDAASAVKKKGGAAAPASLQWQGSQSGIREATAVVIYNDRDWEKLWRQHAPESPMPKIDFNRFMALAVFQGSGSPGRCCVRITGIIQEAGKIRVFYFLDESFAEKADGPFSSFHIKVIKKSAAPVVFTKKRG